MSLSEIWNRQPSHLICDLTPHDKNITLKAILLEFVSSIDIKNGETIYQFLIADATGSIK